MNAVLEWGYAFIHLVQSMRNPLADGLFIGISFLGSQDFYLFLIPLLYWLVDKRMATRLAVLFLASAYLNAILKLALHQPRPSPRRVERLTSENGFGIPSGHAQGSFVTWGWLASQWQDRWFQMAAGAQVLSIGFSRIYLGVHFPSDVFGGWLVGGAILGSYFALIEPYFEPWFESRTLSLRLAVGMGLPLAAALVWHDDTSLRALATLCGLALGVPLERQHVAFNEEISDTRQFALRVLLGFAGTLLLRVALKPILQHWAEPGDFLRYAAIGFWVTFAAPWGFLKLRLARREWIEVV